MEEFFSTPDLNLLINLIQTDKNAKTIVSNELNIREKPIPSKAVLYLIPVEKKIKNTVVSLGNKLTALRTIRHCSTN